MRIVLVSLLIVLLTACGGEVKKLEITEAEIDQYVEDLLDPTEIYDILIGPRYSKEVDGIITTYEITGYEQNDTLLLYTEVENLTDRQINRSIYYKEELPVYIEEYEVMYEGMDNPFKERKIYVNGAEVIQAYQRVSKAEEELELASFEKYDADIDSWDLERPDKAINQQGEYEMMFSEFLILPQSQYLVLDNKESGYSVAYLILQDDEFINELFLNPDKYSGKTVFVKHQFMTLNKVSQMVYESGVLVEKEN